MNHPSFEVMRTDDSQLGVSDGASALGACTASVVLPVFDDLEGLEATLASLRATEAPFSFEIIVCDDAGPPEVGRLAEAFDCVWVRLDRNRGSYAARNAGIAAARGRYLAFIDADELGEPNWLTEGVRAVQQGAQYAGGRIITVPQNKDDFWERYDAAFAFSPEVHRRNRSYPTANLFVDKALFAEIGHFNESLRSGGDMEFGRRAVRHGVEPVFVDAAIAYHPARNGRQQFRKTRRTAAGRAQILMHIERRPLAGAVVGPALKVCIAPVRVAWRMASRRRRFANHGWVEFVGFLIADEVMRATRTFWQITYCFKARFSAFSPFQD